MYVVCTFLKLVKNKRAWQDKNERLSNFGEDLISTEIIFLKIGAQRVNMDVSVCHPHPSTDFYPGKGRFVKI